MESTPGAEFQDEIYLSIAPPNSLLAITGVGARDTPIPDGVATVVASEDTILVMTRYQYLGPTAIRVSIGARGDWPPADLHEVFSGRLRSPGGTLNFGSVDLTQYQRLET